MPTPSKARILFLLIAVVALLGVTRPAPSHAASRAEVRLLHVMNHARTSRGLHSLRLGSLIQTSSERWASYLLRHDAFYHGRISAGTAENLGWLTCRDGWAHTLVRMWLNSPYHRPHLLAAGARRVGVGVARGRWSGYSCVRMAVTRFR